MGMIQDTSCRKACPVNRPGRRGGWCNHASAEAARRHSDMAYFIRPGRWPRQVKSIIDDYLWVAWSEAILVEARREPSAKLRGAERAHAKRRHARQARRAGKAGLRNALAEMEAEAMDALVERRLERERERHLANLRLMLGVVIVAPA